MVGLAKSAVLAWGVKTSHLTAQHPHFHCISACTRCIHCTSRFVSRRRAVVRRAAPIGQFALGARLLNAAGQRMSSQLPSTARHKCFCRAQQRDSSGTAHCRLTCLRSAWCHPNKMPA